MVQFVFDQFAHLLVVEKAEAVTQFRIKAHLLDEATVYGFIQGLARTRMAAAGIGVRAVGEEAGTEPEVIEAIDFLVGVGLEVNTIDKNKETAMHGAAYRNFPDVVDCLAKHGAVSKHWDHKNKWGWTPVMIAQGHRPGSFKPSPVTVEALQRAMER